MNEITGEQKLLAILAHISYFLGGLGFIIAKALASKVDGKSGYQPVVLQVGLPPNAFRYSADNELPS